MVETLEFGVACCRVTDSSFSLYHSTSQSGLRTPTSELSPGPSYNALKTMIPSVKGPGIPARTSWAQTSVCMEIEGLYFGSHVAQAGPELINIAQDDLEPLILLPPPRSAGITGVCHLPGLCSVGDQSQDLMHGRRASYQLSHSCLLRVSFLFSTCGWMGSGQCLSWSVLTPVRVQPPTSLLHVSNSIAVALLSLTSVPPSPSAHSWCVFSPLLCHHLGMTRCMREMPDLGSDSVLFFTLCILGHAS
jgi:hypothetical protein